VTVATCPLCLGSFARALRVLKRRCVAQQSGIFVRQFNREHEQLPGIPGGCGNPSGYVTHCPSHFFHASAYVSAQLLSVRPHSIRAYFASNDLTP
jgi:hypothetical protein